MLCIWQDQKGVLHYELLNPNKTVTADRCRMQLIKMQHALNNKQPLIASKQNKVMFYDENANHLGKHRWKKYRGLRLATAWSIGILSRPCSFWLPLVPIGANRPGRCMLSKWRRNAKIGRWRNSLKRWGHLSTRNDWLLYSFIQFEINVSFHQKILINNAHTQYTSYFMKQSFI